MSARVIMFDNGYRCYIEGHYISDPNDKLIACLHHSLDDLSLELNELSDIQIWALCKPVIQAHQCGIDETKKQMTKKLLSLFNLKED